MGYGVRVDDNVLTPSNVMGVMMVQSPIIVVIDLWLKSIIHAVFVLDNEVIFLFLVNKLE